MATTQGIPPNAPLDPSTIDHGVLQGLADDDHLQYLLLAGRAGGQSALGGTAVGNDLTLRGNPATGLSIGSINVQSPIVLDDAGDMHLNPEVVLYAPTYTDSVGVSIGTGINMSPDITVTSATVWIWSALDGSPTITAGSSPILTSFILFNAAPFHTAVSTSFVPISHITIQSGPTFRNDGLGILSTTNVGYIGFNAACALITTTSGDLVGTSTQDGLRFQPFYSTVASSTASFGDLRAVRCRPPAIVLFGNGSGTEIMGDYIGLEFESFAPAETPTHSGVIVVVRSALLDSTTQFFLQNNGGARSLLGGGHLFQCGQVQIDSDTVGLVLGENQEIEITYNGAAEQLLFNPTSGNTLILDNLDTQDVWRWRVSAVSGLNFQFDHFAFGPTVPDPTTSNYFVLYDPPNGRTGAAAATQWFDVAWGSSLNTLSVGTRTMTRVASLAVNEIRYTLGSGSVADVATVLVNGFNTTDVSTTTQALWVEGRDRTDGFLNYSPTSPAQITADQNNYALPSGSSQRHIVRLNTDASRTITGFALQQTGDAFILINVGANELVIAHQNGSSSASNRILSPTASNISVGANEFVYLWHDSVTDRWRVLPTNGA